MVKSCGQRVFYTRRSPNQEKDANHGGTGWETLTFDFTGVNGTGVNGTGVNEATLIFISGTSGAGGGDWTSYFNDMTLPAEASGGNSSSGLSAIDFEAGGNGASYTWAVSKNSDNPALNIIANPDMAGANTSATVAKFTARADGQAYAGV